MPKVAARVQQENVIVPKSKRERKKEHKFGEYQEDIEMSSSGEEFYSSKKRT